jgi:triphosphoribosyl-dephospho-CoA synthase
MDPAGRVAQLVQEACILEVCAPKPGNVNRCHDFPDTSFEDYVVSAVAIGPAFEHAAQSGVGRIVLQAIEDCRRRVRANTNLGMVLLLAPLAKACLAAGAAAGDCRQKLHEVLRSLTVEDARFAYQAIRAARAGGLGEVPEQDIAGEPGVTLLEAMNLARGRDSIASEYVTGYAITYEIGLPALKETLARGSDFSDAVVQAFLAVLSRVPDTLISRKNGADTARRVSEWAGNALSHGGVHSPGGREKILDLDKALRDDAHKLNPGATADLTAAAIFLALVEMRL